jgi:glycosyltransferase involved in cell wall biosynthesis
MHVDSGRGLRSSQRQVLYLLRGLRERGAEVLLCCPRAGRLHRHADEAGIPTATLTIRSGMDFPSTVRLARLFGEWPADVLHVHDAASQAVARAAQGMNPDQAPTGGMARSCYDGDDEESLNRLHRSDPMLRWIASAPRIRSLLENRGVPPQHIDIVPHAVDLQAFADLPRRQADPWGLRPHAEAVIGTVGHLTRRRNVGLLIQAFSRLRATFPGARLLVVGAGPQTRTLQKLSRSLEIAEAVTFAGAVDDLRSVYATLDVFVLPSDLEVSGQALLDAMAAGVPIVCTASAGVLGLARHGDTALVVPPRDAQALSDSMARLLQDPELAQSIADGARQAAGRHSIAALTERTLESYQKLVAQHGSRRQP